MAAAPEPKAKTPPMKPRRERAWLTTASKPTLAGAGRRISSSSSQLVFLMSMVMRRPPAWPRLRASSDWAGR
jgi:hypothetical protein